ncbi:MAG: GntR family transcriptional regulator [Clostridia bacterium]|nr:GntR family transcriptional regulator [Clostridia bacterium]
MIKLNFLNNDYSDKRSQTEKISDSIMIDILTGNLRPGTWLTEKYLSEKYKLSRTPIREILNRLISTNLIELIPNRGCFVKTVTEKDIEDYFVLSYLLYPQAVKWAIERITKEERKVLEEVYNFMKFYTVQDDLEKIKTITKGFNLVIYDACKNVEIEKTLKLYDFITYYGMLSVPYPKNYTQTVFEEYSAIFRAFAERDSNQGFEAAQIHKYKEILRRK